MLLVIDTEPWVESDVEEQCKQHGVEYIPEFYFRQTCTKLASHLLKAEIAKMHGVDLLTLSRSPQGKPFFENSSVHFNISHHETLAIAVVSTTQPVGIDITDLVTPFADEEFDQLFGAKPPPQMDGIYWATREAYLKYNGQGSRETPVKIQAPAFTALPRLESVSSLGVMPSIRVEKKFARLFKIKSYVGAVIAPLSDVTEVQFFSSDKDD